ncbi:MAG: DUF2269 family protein [Gaiellaceae bacterium]
MEHFALFVHLVGVLLFVGGLTVAAVCFEAARRRSEPAEIAILLGLSRWGVVLVGVGGAVLLVGGLWLAGVVHAYGDAWLDAAIALFIVTVAVGGIGGQRPKQARLLATKIAKDGGDAADLRRLLDDRTTLVLNYVAAALVLAIHVLMIWRPGGS